jgi:hypothetical protein
MKNDTELRQFKLKFFLLAGVFGDRAPRVAICIGVPFAIGKISCLLPPFVTSGQSLAKHHGRHV